MALGISPDEIVKKSKNGLLSIHSTWERVYLGQIAKVLNGYAFKSELFNNSKQGVPLIRIRDVGQDFSDTYYNGNWDQQYLVEAGDILIGMDGDFKCASWKGAPALLNQRVCKVELISNNYEKKFLIYTLQPYLNAIHTETSSVTVKHLSSKSIQEIPLPLPPLAEQKRIVSKIEELFSELNNGIDNLKQAQKQLKAYRQAVLKQAFEGKLTEEWRLLYPQPTAEELLEQIKFERERQYQEQLEAWKKSQSATPLFGGESIKPVPKPKKPAELPPFTQAELADLPNLPKGWVYTSLVNLGELGRGKSKHRPRNDKKLFGGKYPFVQTGEVKSAKGLIKSYETTYSEFGLSQSKLWPVGTLCITIAANIAETAFLGIEACFPDSIVGFTGNEKSIHPKFVDYFIRAVRKKIEAFAPATAQKNINLNTLENLIVPYCSFGEQFQIINEIEARLSVSDKLEETIEKSLQKSEALRQSILKQAFEGKLVAQDPNDEPAFLLLERIKAEKANAQAIKKQADQLTIFSQN